MSMKNSNDTIGNQTRDLPACSTVPQPTAPPAACPHIIHIPMYNYFYKTIFKGQIMIKQLSIVIFIKQYLKGK
jgi:hypothetical protein